MQLYANTPSLCDVLRITCTKKRGNKNIKRKQKMLRIQKKLYILQYENRKYQSKMCTNSLDYVIKNLQYKRLYENDQITHYLEHRGTGTGLVTGQRHKPHVEVPLTSQSRFHAKFTTRSNNTKHSWIKE